MHYNKEKNNTRLRLALFYSFLFTMLALIILNTTAYRPTKYAHRALTLGCHCNTLCSHFGIKSLLKVLLWHFLGRLCRISLVQLGITTIPMFLQCTVPLSEHLCASSVTKVFRKVNLSWYHSLMYKVVIKYSNRTYTWLDIRTLTE